MLVWSITSPISLVAVTVMFAFVPLQSTPVNVTLVAVVGRFLVLPLHIMVNEFTGGRSMLPILFMFCMDTTCENSSNKLPHYCFNTSNVSL